MDLVYPKEKSLFTLSVIFASIFWLVLLAVTFGLMLIYVLLFFVMYLFAQSAFISYLRGTAVRITPQQFPDLHQRVQACAAKLDMKEVPDAYLLHADGVFNALATRFLGRNFIVLFSDVVDALETNPAAVNFYIGHELGHIHRKHLIWAPLLFPAGILPILGAAYSRAREYTCDRYGLATCENPQDAVTGLAALAAGGKRWRTLSKDGYVAQTKATSGFWMSFHELIGDYPWLTKRLAAINALASKQPYRAPRRSIGAMFLALFVPRLGIGGGAGAVLVFVAIIGVLAAIAVPAYQDYVTRAALAGVTGPVEQLKSGAVRYAVQNQKWPEQAADIGWNGPATFGPAIRSVAVEAEGVIVVTLGQAQVAGKSLVYTPVIQEGRVHWECESSDLQPKYLAELCR